MAKPKIGIQLNPAFGQRTTEDLPGVLDDVKRAGFDGVEAGLLCDGDVAQAKRVLGDRGLVQWSLHTSFGPSYSIDEEIDFLNALGGKFIVVSGVGIQGSEGLRPYEEAAESLNRAGEACKAAGLIFCHHNHGWEFEEFDGKSGIERLYELTDPAVVKLCVDVFWALYGGRDPVAFLQEHLARTAFVHLKDLRYIGPEPRRRGVLHPLVPRVPLNGEAEYVELGRGEVDLPAIWRLLEPLNQLWVIYEQDEASIPMSEAATISRKYLRDRLGI
ncbi:MAG: sugar phosphate isomerase/epimerase [SAR202 cluster bacterium]|jgi:sugar phosphate isomerase/epimerase|nr:sugar phosphate isomerase/epimerase [SAR202 cluster bacterium]MDP6714769.1 sugar phosphate isomerase/epimerase [SAR202 cluster bacterium]